MTSRKAKKPVRNAVSKQRWVNISPGAGNKERAVELWSSAERVIEFLDAELSENGLSLRVKFEASYGVWNVAAYPEEENWQTRVNLSARAKNLGSALSLVMVYLEDKGFPSIDDFDDMTRSDYDF